MSKQFRPELQGLRALAVVLVLLFHVWPDTVPGGFIGVDVFFVISGYLITSLLFREVEETGRISLLNFYARRVRRILPAATLILLVVAAATPLLPKVRWEETATSIIAAALYIENWLLAVLAVDYTRAEDLPSAVQHYWSLSIEEQFYLFWPVLMIGVAALARRSSQPRWIFLRVLATVVTASFIVSVLMTAADPKVTYFASYARVWELGLGGLLALVSIPRIQARLSETIRIVGLGGILFAAFGFSASTHFPGYAAALPTIGAALIIAAGSEASSRGVYWLLQSRIAQYTGDISYSIYLWHWPLIVFYLAYHPSYISLQSGIVIVSATLLLSILTKTFVEDPFRPDHRRPGTDIIYGSAAIIACCLLPLSILIWIAAFVPPSALIDMQRYPGATALFGAPVPKVGEPIPSLTRAKRDWPQDYVNGCHVSPRSIPNPCKFGSANSSFNVVLLGDSHAAQWIPALQEIAVAQNWQLTTNTRAGCTVLEVPDVATNGDADVDCWKWGQAVLAQLKMSPPDLVIFTNAKWRRVYSKVGQTTASETSVAIGQLWGDLRSLGTQVVAIRDTPNTLFNPLECLSTAGHCTVDRNDAIDPNDPIVLAAEANKNIVLLDMTDSICSATECPAVVGNVIVRNDTSHMTATYVRTMKNILLNRLKKALSTPE